MAATITWYGHSTMRLTLPDGRVVMIDPWLAENPACPDQLKKLDRCDLILLTHGHFDHVGDVGPLIDQFDPPIIATFELCAALSKTLGKGQYNGMNTGGTQKLEGLSVTLTQAHHTSSVDTPEGPMYAGCANGFVLRAPGLATLYHAGDTDVFTDMQIIAKLLEPKIAILPIGDHFTMGARGAALAVEFLQPEVIIPLHYKTFPLLAQGTDDFQAALPAEFKNRLLAGEVGQELTWTETGAK
jgi:L-ascorbate metabolism protein UlaG (beta-lactamase superfamily)